jgi:hypothetical protein
MKANTQERRINGRKEKMRERRGGKGREESKEGRKGKAPYADMELLPCAYATICKALSIAVLILAASSLQRLTVVRERERPGGGRW